MSPSHLRTYFCPDNVNAMLRLCLLTVLTLPYIGNATSLYYHEVLRMPLSSFVGPNKIEYACLSAPLKADEYIVDFQPDTANGGVHHLALYSCEEPYERHHVWECIDPTHICKDIYKLVPLYNWNAGATGWTLPSFTGVFTGNTSRYIILQIHGRSDLTEHHLDKYASITMKFRTDRPPLDMLVKVYAVDGYIPAKTLGFTTDVACTWNMNTSALLIGYALHTHDCGVAVSAYLIRNGTWIEIGRIDPTYAMLTYDITDRNMSVQPGDIVTTRCTYDNPGAKDVAIGFKHSEEMCNLILHFAIPHSYAKQITSCSNNAQDFHWENTFDNIPSLASDVSGDTDQNRYMKHHRLPKNN